MLEWVGLSRTTNRTEPVAGGSQARAADCSTLVTAGEEISARRISSRMVGEQRALARFNSLQLVSTNAKPGHKRQMLFSYSEFFEIYYRRRVTKKSEKCATVRGVKVFDRSNATPLFTQSANL